jgi:serine protease inhibitor
MSRRAVLRRLTVLMAAVVVAGCGQPAPPPRVNTDSPERWAAGAGQVASASDADAAGTIAGLWAFADRFAAVTAQKGENAVFSPASIGYAFAMLRAGSGGATARQLDKVFGFPASVHDAFTVLRRDIVTADEPPRKSKQPIVAIANGLFVQEGYPVRPDYLRMMDEKYGAAAQHVDFGSGEATEIIDAWVRKQTADRIDRLFDPGSLDANTIAVLANAVYLKANWSTPFASAWDEAFHRADDSTVEVPMMRFAEPVSLNHASGDGWQAVELPYAGGELSMWVLVPTEGFIPPRLTAEALAALGAGELKRVDLALPRWDFEQNIDLLPELAKLGFTALGDLPAFPGGHVDDAIHRANITVDASGTEAAAVTGMEVAISAPPPPEVTVRADRPFTFAIVHKPTGAPMFLGTVADPTAG